MKSLIILLMSLLLSIPAGQAVSHKEPFLAVYCCPGFEVDWGRIKVDYFCTAFNWDQFDDFLKTTKKRAHGRPIEIELAVHGDGECLLLTYWNNPQSVPTEKFATFGYVVNHIEKILGNNVTLICECCHGGATYKTSIRGYTDDEPTTKIESCNHVPKFPIYGGSGNGVNCDNYVFLQYRSKVHIHFVDLRDYEQKDPGPEKTSKDREWTKEISAFFHFLGEYYKQ